MLFLGKQKARKRKEEDFERQRKTEEKKRQYAEQKELVAKQRKEFLFFEYTDIKNKFPTFCLDEHDEFSTFVYIDNSKNLTIKSIDKIKMESVSSTVLYSAIHYYEKVGNIHYVTKIDVEYDNTSIAASFVPSKIRITPMVLGALLLGPMGMAIGAMKGYTPSHLKI